MENVFFPEHPVYNLHIIVLCVAIQGVNPGDSGGWTCRVSATVAGDNQISTDIVRLFVGKISQILLFRDNFEKNAKNALNLIKLELTWSKVIFLSQQIIWKATQSRGVGLCLGVANFR